jgi:hypothetical protein
MSVTAALQSSEVMRARLSGVSTERLSPTIRLSPPPRPNHTCPMPGPGSRAPACVSTFPQRLVRLRHFQLLELVDTELLQVSGSVCCAQLTRSIIYKYDTCRPDARDRERQPMPPRTRGPEEYSILAREHGLLNMPKFKSTYRPRVRVRSINANASEGLLLRYAFARMRTVLCIAVSAPGTLISIV